MSFVVTAPDMVTAAAGELSNIGSGLHEATAAAAGPTTGVIAAAQDEVSVAVSRLFGTFGQEFQAVTAQASAFHDELVGLLNGSAAAYLETEIANAEQGVLNAPVLGGAAQQIGGAAAAITGAITGTSGLPALLGPAAAAAPGGAYQQLFVNTQANLQSLFGAWQADQFPFLRQVIANQMGYWQQISAALTYTIQNFPAVVANLPAAVQAAVQQLLAFNPALFLQQFITTQLGFAQTFATSLGNMVTDLVKGLPAFQAGLGTAFNAVLTGDYFGAVNDVAQAFANLLVTGVNPGTVTITFGGDLFNPSVTASLNPTLLGPLGDFFQIMNIPGQEAQYFTNLIPPSTLHQVSQNFTNVLDALTIPSISAIATVDVHVLSLTATGSLNTFFGLPLVLSYAAAGAPLATLDGLATSATAVQQALLAGDPVGALGALIDAPAVVANGFLNGDTIVNQTIPLPLDLTPIGLPSTTVPIILHLPFDGILVPPHPLTATIDLSALGIGLPDIPVTIGGTPFMGLAPLLINYLPQQLAAAITPTG